MAYKIGDQVQLKSGGPIMTVTGVGKVVQGKSQVECSWIDKAKKPQKEIYPEDALMPYLGEKGSTESIDHDDGDWMTR
jgi:uncharacterized protein YodC (DUF2158 family)